MLSFLLFILFNLRKSYIDFDDDDDDDIDDSYYYYYKMKVSIVFCAKSIPAYLPLFFYRDTTFGLFATTPVSGQ